jgi:drug/metabolite transporter (DMT)-like permease
MASQSQKWFLLVVLALTWGSSFILIKRGLVGLSPIQVGSLRIICAGIFLLTAGFRSFPAIQRQQWKYLALTAFFGIFAPAFLFAIAQTHISSTISSMMNALTSLNTLIIGILAFGLVITRNQGAGVLIGLVGSMLLILDGAMHDESQNYWFALVAYVGAVCYAINVNLLKKYLSGLSPMAISVGNFVVMLVPACVILATTGFFGQLHETRVAHSCGYVALLGIFGTGIANLLFYRLIQNSSPVFATQVTYMIPIVAFGWGVLDGESLSALQIAGAAIVVCGVYLSGKK